MMLILTLENTVINKAEEALKEISSVYPDISDAAFLSIGGADGTEIEHLMMKTQALYGILLEYNDKLAKKAAEKAKILKDVYGKELEIFIGDANQKIDDAINQIYI